MKDLSMTRADLVIALATRMPLARRDAVVVIDTIFTSITRALATRTNPGVELRGLGSFRIRERRPRRGRNPKTGAPVAVPAKRVVMFTPGKDWAELPPAPEPSPNLPPAHPA
jgi:integration host factor subunit beta